MNSKFNYKAAGVDKDGHAVSFGGDADTLQDAIGGVFSKSDVSITDWAAEQKVRYWVISLAGARGGKDASDYRYTFEEPKKSAPTVAGLAIGFDTVYSVEVEGVDASRAEVDELLRTKKDKWI